MSVLYGLQAHCEIPDASEPMVCARHNVLGLGTSNFSLTERVHQRIRRDEPVRDVWLLKHGHSRTWHCERDALGCRPRSASSTGASRPDPPTTRVLDCRPC